MNESGEETNKETQKTSFDLENYKAVKHLCIDLGETVKEFVNKAVQERYEREKAKIDSAMGVCPSVPDEDEET